MINGINTSGPKCHDTSGQQRFFGGSLCPPSRPVSCQALRTQWRQFWPTKGETFPHLKKGQPRSDSAEGLSSCHFGCPFSLFCLYLAPTALVSANVQALLYRIPKECGMTQNIQGCTSTSWRHCMPMSPTLFDIKLLLAEFSLGTKILLYTA